MTFPTTTRLAVRWRDLDPLGHVNSAVFLTYFEEGLTAWFANVLGPKFHRDQYVVARVELDYRSEIPNGTEFVETSHVVSKVGRSSVTFDELLRTPDGKVAAEGRVVVVMWEPEFHRSRLLSSDERDALLAAVQYSANASR